MRGLYQHIGNVLCYWKFAILPNFWLHYRKTEADAERRYVRYKSGSVGFWILRCPVVAIWDYMLYGDRHVRSISRRTLKIQTKHKI